MSPVPQVAGQMSARTGEGRESQDLLMRRDVAFLDGLLSGRGAEAVAFAGAAGPHSTEGAAA
jgi:hypothetical protein